MVERTMAAPEGTGPAAASAALPHVPQAETYNMYYANTLHAGSGLNWFWATDAEDRLNVKKTDWLNEADCRAVMPGSWTPRISARSPRRGRLAKPRRRWRAKQPRISLVPIWTPGGEKQTSIER